MYKNVLFLLFVAGIAIAAQLSTLPYSTDIATTAEMEAYVTDPTALDNRITAVEGVLTGGITTNLSGLVIVDGVVTGTY